MKKLNVFYYFIIILFFISCEEENFLDYNNQIAIHYDNITNDNGILKFDSERELIEKANTVLRFSSSDYTKWANNLKFKSIAHYADEGFSKLEAVSTKQEFYEILNDYKEFIYYDKGLNEVRTNSSEFLARLLNTEGLLIVGNDLRIYTYNSVKTIKNWDGSQDIIKYALSLDNSDLSRNIIVTYDKNSFHNVRIETNCSTHDPSNYQWYSSFWCKSNGNNRRVQSQIFSSQDAYGGYVSVWLKPQKTVLGVWVKYKTTLYIRNVEIDYTNDSGSGSSGTIYDSYWSVSNENQYYFTYVTTTNSGEYPRIDDYSYEFSSRGLDDIWGNGSCNSGTEVGDTDC